LGLVSAAEVELRSGTLRVEVDSSAGPVPFAVRTPVALVAVLGTRFGVRHDDAGTSVAVLRGRVRVTGPSGESVLEAGTERVATGARQPLGDVWRADLVRALGAADAVEPEECRVAAVSVPSPGPVSPTPPSSLAPPVVDASSTAVPAPAGEPASATVPDATAEPSGEELYRQAEAAMAAGRLEEAVGLLERVAERERGRALGGTALIDLGARYGRLGRPADAAAAYRRYLEQHPGGTFRGEARISLCRLERQAGDASAARACYAAYLGEQPDGPYAGEARTGAGEEAGEAP
jgi:hypothetical protein